MTETLGWLVDIPSVTGDEGRICTEVAARLYESVGRDAIDRIGNSLITGRRMGRPLLILAGHLDTVPSQGQGQARVEDGRLHGLGASDMKAGLAVMIHLLEDPRVLLGPYDVVGIFYAGEEGPSHGNELELVLREATWVYDAEFAVVLEPSDGELQVGCNGIINARVTFEGKSAHSARPWLGENAISKAGRWLADMHSRAPEPFEIAGLIYHEVMSVTRAAGGIANNVIPPTFNLNLNYRFAPGRSLEEARALIAEVCAPANQLEIVDAAPAGPVDTEAAFLAKLAGVSGSSMTAKQGWTDVARFAAYGIAAVNYGPGETGEAHQAEESVALADLEKAFDTILAAIVAPT
ncbi:MAG: succinyl-diaminopimelate desuccinylase [Actinomycetota bacterium]